MRPEETYYRKMAVSPDAYTDVSSFVNRSQLSDDDGPVFLRLLRSIHDFDGLPHCNMQVLAGAEHSVQQSAYGA